MMRWIVLGILTGSLALPAARAEAPWCADVTVPAIEVAGVYVVGDVGRAMTVWTESNGARGLQIEVCALPDGSLTGPDAELFEFTF